MNIIKKKVLKRRDGKRYRKSTIKLLIVPHMIGILKLFFVCVGFYRNGERGKIQLKQNAPNISLSNSVLLLNKKNLYM